MKHRSLYRDFLKLMHLPRPLCVLAFATIGASFSEHLYFDRLVLTYIGIVFALCLGGYSLDELHGRPLETKFTGGALWLTAFTGIAGGTLVNIYLALTVSPYILILGILASFFIFAYNLELFDGRFHKPEWFGVGWGGLSTFGGYFAQSPKFNLSSIVISAMASLFSVGIILLTHRFRTSELSTHLRRTPKSQIRDFSRYSRNISSKIADLECYSMVLLAAGLMLPKVT